MIQSAQLFGHYPSVFTVYLILTDGFMHSVIDDFIKGLDMTGWMLLLISFLLACSFFVLAVHLGFIRQGLFAVTVDRNRDRRFELVWDGIEKTNQTSAGRVNT